MQQSRLPAWMRTRTHREIREVRKPSRAPEFVLLSILAVSVVGCILAALKLEAALHLPVIGACIAAFAFVLVSKAEGTKKNFGIFAGSAVGANALMIFTSAVIGNDSALGAIAVVILFTGIIGLLLFSRTRDKPSRSTKAAVMATMIMMATAGPILYLTSPDGKILEYVTFWLLLASIPMTFVSIMTGLVLISYHRSEQTLPSDKWM